jgi:SpoVK/Ycf46/Vps4 family AAA+-type ATPase
VAMSISGAGLDIDGLWERKRQAIEQTPGLSVNRSGVTFDDIGGYDNVKGFITDLNNGEDRPNTIVFIDEIEKMIAGATGDLSGQAQYQLGKLLSYMQDNDADGMIFIGPPGAAKSLVAKATGNTMRIPTIDLDLGGMKGSLMGESEQHLNGGLKVISSVSQGRMLFIATCNSIANLPPELRRRFKLGTFFFDLPTKAEREVIWPICIKKYNLTESLAAERPDDRQWTGAEIDACCKIARKLNRTLKHAATFVVPIAISAKAKIEALRREASECYISASHEGYYQVTEETTSVTQQARTVPRYTRHIES